MWEEPLSSTRWTWSPAGTLASNSSRKAMKLAEVLRSRSVAVKIPPPWTSRAASKIAVPWRTYSCSWRAGRPGATGWVGRVRLRAGMPVFSSTLSTRALVGGTRYSPQMSAARSQKLVVVVDQGAARPLAVLEAGQAFGLEAAAPLRHGVLVHAHHGGDLAVGEAVGGQQHDPGAFGGPLGVG